MKVLVLGVTGMLGSAVFRQLLADSRYEAFGTMRTTAGFHHFPEESHPRLRVGVDVLDTDALISVFGSVQPDVVINCVGLIKQLGNADDPLAVLPLNAMLPHRLTHLCAMSRARLVHISTDCVFVGDKGMYTEGDVSDALDLYGKSKFIGEVSGQPHAITLRTSIIGHELGSKNALIEWFLAQPGRVNGFTKAIFSGLPTVELARVILGLVIPNPALHGLYHVSAAPIDKFSLLKIVAEVYEKDVQITPDDRLVIDRSLDSTRFKAVTGYQPPPWLDLIKLMSVQR